MRRIRALGFNATREKLCDSSPKKGHNQVVNGKAIWEADKMQELKLSQSDINRMAADLRQSPGCLDQGLDGFKRIAVGLLDRPDLVAASMPPVFRRIAPTVHDIVDKIDPEKAIAGFMKLHNIKEVPIIEKIAAAVHEQRDSEARHLKNARFVVATRYAPFD